MSYEGVGGRADAGAAAGVCGEIVQDKHEAGAFSGLMDDKMMKSQGAASCFARRWGFDWGLVDGLNPIHGSRGWKAMVYKLYLV